MEKIDVKRWGWIYCGLALLSFADVGSSLLVNHQLGEQNNRTVEVSSFWADRLKAMEDLQLLASEVNAPGNDVFDSRDVRAEKARFVEALGKYNEHYGAVLSDLKANADRFPLAEVIAHYEAVQPKMDEMLSEAREIFSYFERGQKHQAGSRMATMDRKYAFLRKSLISISQEIRKIQKDFFERQRAQGERLRLFEIVFSLFIVALVIGFITYGSMLSKLIKKSVDHATLAQELKKALDYSAIVAITDTKGKITFVNDKFTEISGFSKDELIGNDHRLINSKFHPKEFFSDLWSTIAAGRVWSGEVRNRKKDSTHYWVDSTIVPMTDSKGKIYQYIAIRHDVTERKKLEEALVEAKNHAEAATRTKSSFLANMSHEIRTPMNGIIGMSNLLLSSATDPTQVERLTIIQNCGNSLLELINDVLDFSKLEVDKIELEKRPFGLHATTKEIVELLGTRASERGITVSYTHEPNVPAWILGDVTRFRQILTNLVSNALKFTEAGSVEIASSAKRKEGNLWEIQFTVKDTGIGIPEEVRSKLFQSFSQVDASTNRRFGGSGLGLAISKGLCEKMGGKISFESEVGKGSVFTFTLQAEESRSHVQSNRTDPFFGIDPEVAKERPIRILVVDDNRINQLVAVGFLEKLGYHADVSANGIEALERLAKQPYDLILMDCHMPGMDGFEATKRIISTYGGARPRIIALTASTIKEDVDRCLASGMDGFIGKPISISALAQTLRECRPRSETKIS